ncbi:DegT/DnrJ/EryC1/StrS family aminotransferase [Caldithrix abyssi]
MKYIPSLQAISPFYFIKPSARVFERYYPFDHSGLHLFYFARNGIYFFGKYLKSKGINRILFPAYNHGNEIRALLASGLKLEYYNIHASAEIDFEHLERQLKDGDFRVLYFIHYVGIAQNLEKIIELKEKYDLILIEDNALGLFSEYRGRPLGSFGDFGIFCFYKTLPIPNGGGLVINNDSLRFPIETVPPQLLSTISRSAGLFFNWLDLRFNGLGRKLQAAKSKLSSVADKMDVERVPVLDTGFAVDKAAWGISKLSRYLINRISVENIIKKRRENFNFMLKHIPEKYHLFSELPDGAVPWFFPVKIKNREPVFQELTRRGVDCARFWRHFHPDIPAERFPEIKTLRDTVLELPIHQDLTDKHLKFVCDQFNQIAK